MPPWWPPGRPHGSAGIPVHTLTYNGRLPGPVLRVREGDRVQLRFQNGLDQASNLHLHGLHLSPAVDAPFTHLMPGEAHVYEFTAPTGSAGTYWYHPHPHGEVAAQLFAGLAGALIVEGGANDHPDVQAAEEHLLVLKDTTSSSTASATSSSGTVHLDVVTGVRLNSALRAGRSVSFVDAQGNLVAHAALNARGMSSIVSDRSARFESASRVTITDTRSGAAQSYTLVRNTSASAVLMIEVHAAQTAKSSTTMAGSQTRTVTLASVLNASLVSQGTAGNSSNTTSTSASGTVTSGRSVSKADGVSGSTSGASGSSSATTSGSVSVGTSGSTSGATSAGNRSGQASSSASGSSAIGVSVGGVSVGVGVGGSIGVGVGGK